MALRRGRFGLSVRIAVLLLAWAAPTFASGSGQSLRQLHHSKWTTNEGVPGQVGAIAQTTDGYLWLGSNRSLYRFDGVRFVQFRQSDGDTVATVSSMLASPDGGLWLGLRAGGVAYIDDNQLELYEQHDGVPSGTVYRLARENDGTVWAATANGLGRFDGRRWQGIDESWNFSDANVRAVHVDRSGAIWAASGDGRLAKLAPGSSRFIDVEEGGGWIGQFAESPDGDIWIAGRYGTGVRKLGSETMIDVESSGIAFDRSGALWISTLGEGAWRIRNPALLPNRTLARGDSALEIFSHESGLSGDYTSAVFEDMEGNVWIGTSGGLDRVRRSNVVRAAFPSGSHTFALAPGDDGSVLGGTINRPVMQLRDGEVSELPIPPPVTSAYRDPSGNVWMGTPGHLWQISEQSAPRAAELPGGETSFVRAMAADGRGGLWVSVNAIGLFRFARGEWMLMPPASDELSQAMPVSAANDAAGRAWFGYRDNLVVMRDGESSRFWGADDGIEIGNVTALAPEGERTWIAGQHGVAVLDGNRFRRVPLVENESLNRIYAIFESPTQDTRESNGRDLWIHSVAGIFQVPGAELKKALADPDYRVLYRSFDRSGGLPDDPIQIVPLPTAITGSDGRLWFATSNGVVWIDPKDISRDPRAPVTVIEALRADDQYFAATGNNRLPALTRRIVIEYSAPSLTGPESVQFRYRLEGYDKNWVDAGSRRDATYTGLRPGHYRFQVVAFSSDGVLSEAEATTAFSVAPALYQRKLFYVTCVAAMLLTLWLTYRMQVRMAAERLRLRLTERHEERERIARELHDTLLQSVQGLLLRFQSVADRMPADDPSHQMLESALDRADQALVEGRDRVRGLRTAANADLVKSLEATGRELAQGHPSAFHCFVSGTPKPIRADTRDELFWIGQEALLNAFHHAAASAITAELRFEPRCLQLCVRDDGRGIQAADLTGRQPGHWGFAGMRERATRIGASFDVTTQPDTGLELVVTVPAAVAWNESTASRLATWQQRNLQRRAGR